MYSYQLIGRLSKLSVILIFLLLVAKAFSQTELNDLPLEKTISVEGLTIPCVNCFQRNDGLCEVIGFPGSQGQLRSCKLLATDYILNSLESSKSISIPTISEIEKYLSLEVNDQQLLPLLLKLLFQSVEGQQYIITNAQALASKFTPQLREIFLSEKIPPRILAAFWNLPVETDQTWQLTQLKILAWVKNPELGLEPLFSAFSTIEPKQTLELLQEIKLLLLNFPNKLSQSDLLVINQSVSVLKTCFVTSTFNSMEANCNIQYINNTFSGSVNTYFNKLLVKQVITNVDTKIQSPFQILQTISRVDYQNFSNLSLFNLVFSTLNQIEQTDFVQLTNNDPRVDLMLKYFAQNDLRIKNQLNKISEKPNANILLLITMGISGLILLGILLVLKQRKDDLKKEETSRQILSDHKQRILNSAEIVELNKLLDFFRLSAGSTEKDLTKYFRSQIRSLHPDVSVDKNRVEDFMTITQKYKRTKVLLKKKRNKVVNE